MSTTSIDLRFEIYCKGQFVLGGSLAAPIEFGRQRTLNEECFRIHDGNGSVRRAVIATSQEVDISRQQLQLEPVGEQRVKISNLSRNDLLIDSVPLAPQGSQELRTPCAIEFGNHSLYRLIVGPQLGTLSELAPVPSQGTVAFHPEQTMPAIANRSAHRIATWLQGIISVLESAAFDAEFYQRATQAAVRTLGLDFGCVFRWNQGNWTSVAEYTALQFTAAPTLSPSNEEVLHRLLAEKRTVWCEVPREESGSDAQRCESILAAPILDREGKVVAALCGYRLVQDSHTPRRVIRRMEAMLLETLAYAVGVGLARLDQEMSANRARFCLEQFFTSALAQRLADDPSILHGKLQEATLLFCDIRGFSRISERLQPEEIVAWVSDVMTVLSDCVLQQEGVVVEYIGDELMAMWGVPIAQPDQAQRAAQAAVAMMQALPILNQRWQSRLGAEVAVGIGINSGPVHVGNVGSQQKFKYGPMGHHVNLASRVQGANKYLGTNILVTTGTRCGLSESLLVRRLCKVRVVNIKQAIDLFELRTTQDDSTRALCCDYEAALQQFESREFSAATHSLGKILQQWPGDGPSLALLAMAVEQLRRPAGEKFEPVWEFLSK